LESKKRNKYRKKPRKSSKNLLHRLRRYFTKLFYSDSLPNEYKPYLGPDAAEDQIEKQKFENTRANLKKYTKRQRRKKISFARTIKKWRKKWNQFFHKRKKQKQKIKLKKQRLKKKRRRRRRVNFIRNIFPQYKKSTGVSVEFSVDGTTNVKGPSKKRGYLTYTINSTALYMIAYLLVYIVYQLTVLVVASQWKLDSVLYYHDLAFNDLSPLWNRLNIIAVTISGPLISLLTGLLFLGFFTKISKTKKTAKLFMLWIGLHGSNLFLGAFASGISFDEGFGYVPAWLYFNVFWQIFIALIFLFLLGVIGYSLAPKFLDTSYSPQRINKKNKIKFLSFQVVLPWLIGGLLIFLTRIPNNNPYDVANTIVLAFAVIPLLFNRHSKPTSNFKVEKRSSKVKIWLIVILFTLFLLYRIGLNNGLQISLYYKFIFELDITPL